MYNELVHAHSGLRWIVLIFLLLSIGHTFYKGMGNGKWNSFDKAFPLGTLISSHIQFLLGIVLYFMSPLVNFSEGFMKNPVYRFYGVEHISLMLIAIVLITIGYSKSKKASDDQRKFKLITIFYSIALILILVSIPWPFRNLGAGWF